ncbi:MAG: glutamine synthetase type III, partial [Planctomycetota bacterium]
AEHVAVFEKHGVLAKDELEARAEILLEAYAMSINIEAMTMLNMAKRQILPACVEYSFALGKAVGTVSSAGVEAGPQKELLEDVCGLIATMKNDIATLEEVAAEAQDSSDTVEQVGLYRDKVIPAMSALRATADELETMVDAGLWPIPTYAEMLFMK